MFHNRHLQGMQQIDFREVFAGPEITSLRCDWQETSGA